MTEHCERGLKTAIVQVLRPNIVCQNVTAATIYIYKQPVRMPHEMMH